MEVRPKKALGQHFLKDLNIARRIANTIDVAGYDELPVLEIGPGTGVLTQFLLEKVGANRLKAVEIDHESMEYLKRTFPKLNVTEGDFLEEKIDDFYSSPFILTGNYPYNISSQIFFKLLNNKDMIPLCTGMLQREVAQRICAAPGNRTRGILSVLLQVWYDCEYLFTVDENVFNPPPKVKSGVIRLIRNEVTDPGCDYNLMRKIVKVSFGMRRKTLRNSLGGMIPPDASLRNDDIMGLRPEQLSVEQFVWLTNAIEDSRR